MSLEGIILNGALMAVGIAFPAAAPAIAIAQRLEPYAEVAIPLLKAAVTQGPEAYQAAKKAAPDFFAEVSNLATQISKGLGTDKPDDMQVAQLAFHLAGVDPPGWAHEDTQRWWDREGAGTQS